MRPFLLFLPLSLLFSCNMVTPEKAFDVAVLNTNTITSFGGREIYDWLQSPPMAYDAKSKQMVASSYVDCVKFKFSYAEKALKDIQELPVTEETKPMIEASKDLFAYAVDKEEKGYVAIAKMKDDHAPDDQIAAAAADFTDKYRAEFQQKYDKLVEIGKGFAAKHDIKATFN